MKFITILIQTCLLLLVDVCTGHVTNTNHTSHTRLSYADHGLSWGSLCSGGLNQSPINVDSSSTKKNKLIHFQLNYQDMHNATLTTPLNGSQISTQYPNQITSDFNLVDQIGRKFTYHLQSMNWKIPSEHTINNRQYAAELQIVHYQTATNKQLIYSILFDLELEKLYLSQGKHAKTCFVDSFDFDLYVAAIIGNQQISNIQVPLRQFMEYIPQTDLVFYYGSQTVPSCQETVTWIVNTKPHLITLQQRQQLLATLSNQTQSEGGNYRNIQQVNSREVYSFDNVDNYAKMLQALQSGAQRQLASIMAVQITFLLLIY